MAIKLVRIINRLNVGGPSYNVAYLSKFLSPKYLTHIFSGQIEKDEASSEYILDSYGLKYAYIKWMHRSVSPINDYRAYRELKKKIKSLKPEIVHTHAAKAGALGRLAARKAGVKIIVHTYHGNVFDGYFSPAKTKLILAIERYLCKISSKVIAISDEQKRDLTEKYKVADESKVVVIPLGFDLARFKTDYEKKRTECRQEFGLSDQELVITIVGRLAPIKNHKLFIKTLSYLKKKGISFKALIVGDGELYQQLIQQCGDLDLTANGRELPNRLDADIVFTSWRKDVDRIYAASDIVALTSLNEGTPVSLIEALASGAAVISTDVGGVASVIRDGVNGLLSSVNEEDFSAKMESLITDAQLRRKFRENAPASARKFSHDRLVADIDNLYTQLLENTI